MNGDESILDEYELFLVRRRYAPTSVRNRLSYVRRLIDTHDPATVEAWPLEEWIHSHGWKPESLNGAITALKKFFDWMHRSGRRADNPAAELHTVPLLQKKPRIADDETIRAGLARSRPSTQLMILLASECGLRRHEIAKANRDDIDGDRLRVVGKGGRERFVYLSADVLELLGRMPATGWLFPAAAPPQPPQHGTYGMFQKGCTDETTCPRHPDTGITCRQASRDAQTRSRHGIRRIEARDNSRHMSPESVYQAMRRALGVNPHSLRHRAATTVYRGSGHDIRLTQEFCGHASPEMTARYVHIDERDLRRASDLTALRGSDESFDSPAARTSRDLPWSALAGGSYA